VKEMETTMKRKNNTWYVALLIRSSKT